MLYFAVCAVGNGSEPFDRAVGILRDGTDKERERARQTIYSLKPLSEVDQRKLMSTFADKSQPGPIRTLAFETFVEIRGSASSYEEVFTTTLRDRREPMEVRVSAVAGMHYIGASDQLSTGQAQILLDVFKDRTEAPEVRRRAILALSELQSLADEALKSVHQILVDRDESTDVRIAVLEFVPIYALVDPIRYKKLNSQILQVSQSKTESTQIRVRALDSFCDIMFVVRDINGTDFRATCEQWSREISSILLNPSANRRVRDQAGWALRSLPIIDDSVIPQLAAELQRGDKSLHFHYAAALSICGGAAQSAVPVLIKVLGDENEPVEARDEAADALRKISPQEARANGINAD